MKPALAYLVGVVTAALLLALAFLLEELAHRRETERQAQASWSPTDLGEGP